MIHYINISKKRLVGRNNQPNTMPLILDFHTLGNIQFCLIDDKNQIRALPDNVSLTFAGSVKMGEISQNILFLSTTYTVSEDNVINFTVDTYTEPFLTQIKKKNTEINVEISIKFEDGHQKLLLRDYAYACPRVYIEGVPPTPVESYYTKDEVDSLITDVKADIPTKTSELTNDSGFITSSQIDLSDYYTKEETNTKLSEKADLSSLADYQPLSGMNVYALNADIPTKTSELINDNGFITSSQIDLSDYYTKEETNAKLDEKADKTAIPTKTSELTNDSGFITSGEVDFSDYYTKEETNAKLDEKADSSSLANYQPLSGMNVYALKYDIPTRTSELTNDSGFITDEALSAYQPISGMNIYALKTDIPTKTSELTNDSGYITSSQIDFSDYYTKEESDNKFATKNEIPTMNAITIEFGDRVSEGAPTRLQYGDRI